MITHTQRNFLAEYHLDLDKPSIDDCLHASWQNTVDILARTFCIPVALVMEIHPETIEVAAASRSTPGNPYTPGDCESLGKGLYCEAVLRSQHPLLVQNALEDPQWDHNPDIDLGMIFYYGLPVNWPDGSSFGTICILSRETCEFTLLMRDLMRVMRQNIESGLNSLYLNYQATKARDRLNCILEDTITALVNAMSYRDPYTAVHQRRVAELSVAIAQKLNLPETTCHGLFLGGLIHDIGKIYVPSEILCRPGKLSPIEFEFVKSHPRVGAEIVRDVQFPWPISEIILQHHERLDGSGYPYGLTGESIILEARIVQVADVVEAISSHRPYRKALGLDVALSNLRSGRDRIYDADVVDACEAIFRDNPHFFKEAHTS